MNLPDRSSKSLGRVRLTAGALFLCLAWNSPGYGEQRPVFGAAHVVDGDTVDVAGQRVRLEGIDAPETSQTCGRDGGGEWRCGKAAAQSLIAAIGGASVMCERRGEDAYGRVLGICFADGVNLNERMVRRGLAWAFVKYSSEFVAAEAEARAARIGIWQGPAVAPWEHRRKAWQTAEAIAPSGCAIKGNISDGGRIYHTPWSAWYDKARIDESRGERWFCSEAEALAAGWRPAAAP